MGSDHSILIRFSSAPHKQKGRNRRPALFRSRPPSKAKRSSLAALPSRRRLRRRLRDGRLRRGGCGLLRGEALQQVDLGLDGGGAIVHDAGRRRIGERFGLRFEESLQLRRGHRIADAAEVEIDRRLGDLLRLRLLHLAGEGVADDQALGVAGGLGRGGAAGDEERGRKGDVQGLHWHFSP